MGLRRLLSRRSLWATDPGDILMVVKGGTAVLFDESLRARVEGSTLAPARSWGIEVGGRVKRVAMDIPGLLTRIREHLPGFEPTNLGLTRDPG